VASRFIFLIAAKNSFLGIHEYFDFFCSYWFAFLCFFFFISCNFKRIDLSLAMIS